MRPVTPSATLAEIVGPKPIPRTEVTKRLWAYIKKHKLQDAKNRRMINADASLKPVFGGKSTVNMFEMTKLFSKHLK
jgi:chromatin remodeling complex protein RSC6